MNRITLNTDFQPSSDEGLLASLSLILLQQGTFFSSVSLINKGADQRVTRHYEPLS